MKPYENQGWKAWNTAFQMLECVSKTKITDNIRKLVFDKWYETKKIYFPYLDEDFRKKIAVSDGNEVLTTKDIMGLLDTWENNNARNLMCHKEKYDKLDFRNTWPAIDFFRNLYRDELTNEEIIAGRLLESKEYEGLGKMNKGMKISKVIKAMFTKEHYMSKQTLQFYGENNKDLIIELMLDFYSQIYSDITSDNSIVVLSLNPIDLLLISTHNAGDWSTCHNFIEPPEGWQDWRVAGFSYNFMPRVFVAYAYQKEVDLELINDYGNVEFQQPLPYKLWRQMVYIDVDTKSAYLSDQYPSSSPLYTKYARKMAGILLADIHKDEKAWRLKDFYGSTDIVQGEELTDEEILIDFDSYHGYTDCCNQAIALMNGGDFIEEYIEVDKTDFPCLSCGEIRNRNKAIYDDCRRYLCPKCE